ncbi:hypothetical protein ES707_04928 [subsurface metagenome]
MRQERRATHAAGPRMRPEDPSDADKITAGVLRSMQMGGYDYPVRKLRRSGGVRCVTLPLQVRNFLALERGDWLAFGEPSWPGLAAFVKVTAEQYDCIAADGRKEFRRLARKVQGGNGLLFVNIPQLICEILSAEIGNFLIFGLAPRRGTVTVAAIKGGGDSAGSRRTG